MIKAPISLQDLRRRIYREAKADKAKRLRESVSGRASAGSGGVRNGCTRNWGCTTTTRFATTTRKRRQSDKPHNPHEETSRKAECGKTARSV